jgi:hypothetical protein
MKDIVSNLFQKQHLGQVILSVLFLVFLVMGYPLPYSLAVLVDTVYGKIFVILIGIILFLNSNPIVGVLGFLVCFQLIVKSSIERGTYNYNTHTEKVSKEIDIMNRSIKRQQYDSLEHEIIRKMAPTSNDFGVPTNLVDPSTDNLHNASFF